MLTPPDLKRKRQGNYCTWGFVHNLAVNDKKIRFSSNLHFPSDERHSAVTATEELQALLMWEVLVLSTSALRR